MIKSKKDYTGSIQNLLYNHPLNDHITENNVNILVLGFSDISEKFVDLAFEMAQVCSYKLHITVASDNINDEQEYLTNRPAFTDFFSVNENVIDDNYGTLTFINTSIDSSNDNVLELLTGNENIKYSYLFIGSENDDLNCSIASTCLKYKKELKLNYAINCVSEYNSVENEINYIHRNDTIENHKDYKLLKSMAFNCHLVWNDSKVIDISRLQKQFLKNYNYVACLSYVISLKYKLASIGLDFLDKSTPEKIDRLVKSRNSEDKTIVQKLIANEHKRWNVNMICRGYKTAKSLEDYINGTKAKANGYHPCLVKGTGTHKLNNDIWKRNNHEKWDNYSPDDLESLDELDRTSVLLHREYVKCANKIKLNNIITQSEIDIINKLLDGNIKAKNALDKYFMCIQEIIAGNNTKTALFEHYQSVLNKELSNISLSQARIIKKRINALTESFGTILESEKYIDYKQYDVDLINKIPFILTYRSNLHIGIPVDVTNINPVVNSAAFRIVESALLINPSRITYFCECEKGDIFNLNRILEYAIKSMNSHHLRAALNICILATDYSVSEQEKNTILSISKRIHSVEVLKSEKEISEYSKRRHLQIFEFNRTRVSSILEHIEYCCKSNYKYNRQSNKFTTTNCDEIKYLVFKPFLRISDIFELKNSIDDYSFPDMQKDYNFFWKLYKSQKGSEKKWKALCEILMKQDKQNEFEITDIKSPNISKTYLIEKACLDSTKKICEQIINVNEEIKYNIELYSYNSYKISIDGPESFHKTIATFLNESYKLHDPNSISIRKYKDKAYIYHNTLNTGLISTNTIRDSLTPLNVLFSEIRPLLKDIQDNGYIRNLTYNESGGFSFSYSTHQIKQVLIQSGRILELFVYYKLLETGRFDDIANSVEIHWGNDAAENEIDIIATKGYKVLIIECKAQVALSQDYYNKLCRLNSDYGLNSVPVIVADTLEIDKHMEENAKMMEIGKRVGIHTLYTQNDISNIGYNLAGVLGSN